MLQIFTSTVSDGSMKPLGKDDVDRTSKSRSDFLNAHGIRPSDTTCVRLGYNSDNYCRYQTVGVTHRGDGIIRPSSLIVDGLVTAAANHALFLPLADCIGAVVHDPKKNILMVSHLGRHNLEQFGGTKSVEYLVKNHGVDPKKLSVWLSPAASKDHYPLFSFNNQSLHDVAAEQCIVAGVLNEHITSSPIDSAADNAYYSHSQFLKAKRDDDGRFAIVATMK